MADLQMKFVLEISSPAEIVDALKVKQQQEIDSITNRIRNAGARLPKGIKRDLETELAVRNAEIEFLDVLEIRIAPSKAEP